MIVDAQFRFATDKLKSGRYVCVVASAQPYCFVDEIEVFQGDAAWLVDRKPGMTAESPRAFYRQMRVRSGVAARLREDLATIVAQAEGTGGGGSLDGSEKPGRGAEGEDRGLR